LKFLCLGSLCKTRKSDLTCLGVRTGRLGDESEFRRPMGVSRLRANPRRQPGGAKVQSHTASQVFQPGSVDNRFTKIETRSNVSVWLDARVIEARSEINLTVALHRRAAFDGNAGFDLGGRADVTRCLDLRRGGHLSRLVDPDTLLDLRSCGLDPATSLQRIFHQLSIFGGGRKTHDIP